jgi:hypothetical protein
VLTQSNRRPHNRHPRRNQQGTSTTRTQAPPAKTKQIFDNSHPYFPKSCKGCKFNKGLKNELKSWFTNAGEDCYKCVNIVTTKNETTIKKRLFQYNEEDWDKTYITSTGFVVTQKKRIAEGKVSKNEIDKYNKELRMCMILADNGCCVEFLKGKNRPIGETYDIIFDGIKADLKCITGGPGNIVKYTKTALEKQGGDAVVLEIPSHANEYIEKLAEARRKCNGRIFFYFPDELILKKGGQL